jgi:hypothetical protein
MNYFRNKIIFPILTARFSKPVIKSTVKIIEKQNPDILQAEAKDSIYRFRLFVI